MAAYHTHHHNNANAHSYTCSVSCILSGPWVSCGSFTQEHSCLRQTNHVYLYSNAAKQTGGSTTANCPHLPSLFQVYFLLTLKGPFSNTSPCQSAVGWLCWHTGWQNEYSHTQAFYFVLFFFKSLSHLLQHRHCQCLVSLLSEIWNYVVIFYRLVLLIPSSCYGLAYTFQTDLEIHLLSIYLVCWCPVWMLPTEHETSVK